MSTSEVMKNEVAKYTAKPVLVTPFGVNTSEFQNDPSDKLNDGVIRIGTIKPIEEKYGICYIIEAAHQLVKKHNDKKFRFYLIGQSYNVKPYKELVEQYDLVNEFEFTGRIAFSEIAKWHNKLDIFLNVSIDDSESFGVATVEAMCSETPVIVTNVGGLKEVVENGQYGKVIPKKDSDALAAAIEDIILNKEKALQIAAKARKHVLQKYDWKNNLALMIEQYQILVK